MVEEAQGGVCQGDALLVAGLDHHVVRCGAPGGRDERHAALQRRRRRTHDEEGEQEEERTWEEKEKEGEKRRRRF